MKTLSIASSVALLLATAMVGCGGDSGTDTGSASSSGDGGISTADTQGSSSSEADTDAGSGLQETTEASGESGVALTIGQEAPNFQVAGFLKGEEFTELKPGNVYVIEFWATWCRPCIMNMPHLAQLQSEYGDKVTFVGVTDEDPAAVEKFLARTQSEGKTWDDVISYRLVQDTESEYMYTNYFRAAGQEGIPWACIVGRDGIVEWHGYPAAIDEPLSQVVAGSWDRSIAMAQIQKQEAIKEVEELANSGEISKAIEKLKVIVEGNSADIQAQVFLVTLLQADGKSEEALSLLRAVAAENPEVPQVNGMIADALLAEGQTAEAYEIFTKMVTDAWDNPRVLDGIAWAIATEHKEPDLELAKKAAMRAVELTESKDASSLETTARVLFASRDLPGAIAWQKKAIEARPNEPGLKETLAEFEAAAKEAPAP